MPKPSQGLSVFAAAIALATIGLPAHASTPLFTPAHTVAKQQAVDPVRTALEHSPSVASLQEVNAAAALVTEDQKSLRLNLAPGLDLEAEQGYAYRNKDGTLVWSGSLGGSDASKKRLAMFGGGEYEDDPLTSVILVRNGNRLTGTVHAGNALYRIEPLRNGQHAIIKVDTSRMPPEHPPGDLPVASSLTASARAPQGIAAESPVVRVAVAFTQEAANEVGDVQAKAQLAIAETNQGYVDSGINATLELAGVRTVNYTTAGFGTDLERFTGTDDGYLDDWHDYRNSVAADLSVLINNSPEACGMAYVNADASLAFSVTEASCMTGYYSFGHEIGHNFGALHDPESGSNNTTYPYGHGYLGPNNQWRTVMAYDCSGGCPRINRWSTPNRSYNGARTGTAEKHDNARVLNQRAATMAGMR